MNRFWSFPVVLVLVGALYPLVSTIEGMLSAIPLPLVRYWLFHPGAVHINWESTAKRLPWTLVIGALAGLLAAALKEGRGHARGSQWQLVGNLFWCGLYAHIPLVLNVLLIVAAQSQSLKLGIVGVVTTVFPAILNACAIVWATTRTITSEDVLTPRVFLAKLKRSAKLTG